MSPDPEGTKIFEIFLFKLLRLLEKKTNTHAFRHCVLLILHMAGLRPTFPILPVPHKFVVVLPSFSN